MGLQHQDKNGRVSLLGVRKSYGALEVVKGINLEVRSGEFVSLLGPSGCGKTTVLRMLAGFEEINAGDIQISGRSVVSLPPHRRTVNTVFQSYALFPHMTVAENVAYGPRQKVATRADLQKRVAEALESVRMTSFANKKPAMLSGGQQQRVALARALINRPSVLLLDEPFAALDRKLREEMQIELKLLQSQTGTTFIFVTHDQEEALAMSDRIAVMRQGMIAQFNKPMEIYDNPSDAFVADFIGQQNFFHGRWCLSGVETTEGILKTCESPSWASTQVIAAVRPEHVAVLPQPTDECDNQVPAAIVGLSFLGDSVRIVCETHSGNRMIAKGPPSQSAELGVGQQVWCVFSKNKTKIFAQEFIV